MAVRLTTAGAGVVPGATVLLACGVMFDYPELVALGSAGLLLVVVAVAWLMTRPAVYASRVLRPLRVTAGAMLTCELTVANPARFAGADIDVTETVGEEPLRFTLAARPGELRTQLHRYTVRAGRRGVYALTPPTLEMFDPTRLARRRCHVDGQAIFWVHPAYHRLTSLGEGRRPDIDGLVSAPRGDGISFYSLRDYLPGDDSRLIHWPSTARAGRLVVRHNSSPDAAGYVVLLDTSSAAYTDESFEDAVRVAASLCISAIRHGAFLRLRTARHTLVSSPWIGAAAQTTAVLDFLAGVDRHPDDVLGPALLARDDTDAGIAVITGTTKADAMAVLTRSAARVDVVLIRLDPGADVGRAAGPFPVITAPDSARFADYWEGSR